MALFITFEGVEGCGKSTQAHMLSRHLISRGYRVSLTREPGGTVIGNSIREILLSPKNDMMDRYTELFLYLAARVQHISETIIPALKTGSIVICDRFSDATRAYQGCGRGIPLSLIDKLHKEEPLSLKPDITFLLDLEPALGLRRARKRNREKRRFLLEGRFEDEAADFHRRVRNGYLKIWRKERKRIRIIDGTRSIKSIHEEILSVIDHLLAHPRGA